MKSRDLFKDIFSLAVRLLGLVFLYLGLSAGRHAALLDFSTIQTPPTPATSSLPFCPIAFNLLVAWWLLGGGWLIRRAYPETLENFTLIRRHPKKGAIINGHARLSPNERRTWMPPIKSSPPWWKSQKTTGRPDASNRFFK